MSKLSACCYVQVICDQVGYMQGWLNDANLRQKKLKMD